MSTQLADLPARPLGPQGVIWYAAADVRALVAVIRLLVHQVAHPMVGAGVGEHSVYKTDPWGRLLRTTNSVVSSVYGGVDAAVEGQRLLRMHAQIKGVDAAGRRYHALDPDAYAWVHATAYEGTRLFLLEAGPGLTDAQDEQLFTEWRRLGLLIGVRDSALPRTRAEFWELWDRTLPQLENNPVVQDLLWSAPTAPPYVPQKLVDLASAPVLRRQREVMAVTLDPALRARIGLPEPTDRVRRRVQRTMRLMRLGNGLPERVRHNPLTWRTAARTAADPRLGPEPVRYP